jgi:hypothetical protein
MRNNGGAKRHPHSLHVKAEKAMKEAVAEVIKDHARTGDPVAIWRDGKVAWVSAAQLLRQKLRPRKLRHT